jgi:hypothetical protein
MESFTYMHRFIKDSLDAFNAAASGAQKINPNQCITALQRQGMRVSDSVVKATINAFRDALTPEQRASKRGDVDFDEYLELVTHLGLLRSIFEARDPSRTGRVSLSLEELMTLAIEIV